MSIVAVSGPGLGVYPDVLQVPLLDGTVALFRLTANPRHNATTGSFRHSWRILGRSSRSAAFLQVRAGKSRWPAEPHREQHPTLDRPCRGRLAAAVRQVASRARSVRPDTGYRSGSSLLLEEVLGSGQRFSGLLSLGLEAGSLRLTWPRAPLC